METREEDEPLFKLKAARLAAVNRWPYFAPQLLSMVLVQTNEVPTCGTDTLGRFYFNEDFVKACSVQALATIWLHECLHVWLDHAGRVNGRNFRKWNIAADREINDDLAGENFPFPKDYPPHLPKDIGCEDGKLAEFYFEQDPGQEEDQEEGQDQGQEEGDEEGEEGDTPGQPEDGGSSMDGRPRPWEKGPEDESGVSEVPAGLREVIKQQVSQEIEEHAKNAGHVPAGILAKARENLAPPKVPWQKELAAAVRACVADIAGAVDFTYKRPSRRQSIYGDIVMPATRRPIPETAIVLDTSGSMFGADLDEALVEIQGVIRALGGKGVRVLATDAEVHSTQKVTRASKVEPLGGGGTDMRVGLEVASKLRPKLDLCIVLTDGYTPWPAQKLKGMRVIVVVTTGGRTRGVPTWMRLVKIES